jgi:hypothetical protein
MPIDMTTQRPPADGHASDSADRKRDVSLVLLGVLVLVLKSKLTPFAGPLFRDYAGNVAASFALYFLLKLPSVLSRFRLSTAAVLAVAATALFEATDGFGFMSNTYDPGDYLANAAGVGFAAGVDMLTTRICRSWRHNAAAR